MKALVLRDNPRAFYIEDIPTPIPQSGEVRVRIHTAALNHRDEWIYQGQYARIQYPAVLGSDGAGIIDAVGDDDHAEWLGKEVVINPQLGWGDRENAQHPKNYQVLGMPTQGTFAEYVVVRADRINAKPKHLTMEQAAALPLAGLTAFRAVMTQAEITDQSTVLITGIGGGVAQFALQFAVAQGANVWVTSSSDAKIEQAIALGAKGGVNYHAEQWHNTLIKQSGECSVVIDSAGGDQINTLLEVLQYGGRYIFFGATLGKPQALNIQRVFWKQLRLQGTTMGSDREYARMLEYVAEKSIVPRVDSVFALEQAEQAFATMRIGTQSGKIVLRVIP
jgi:zinc-binding alcohol dehydrogenase/oxidoreductase